MEKQKPDPDKKHKCTIVLDTNQFIRDITLAETRWNSLIDYIRKTEASIIMPRVVWDETQKNFKKKIADQLKKLQDITGQYNKLIDFHSHHHNYHGSLNRIESAKPELGADELSERHLAYIKSKLGLRAQDFIEIKTSWYEDIYQRALAHQKPFSEDSDKGFKDTILWKSILSLARRPGYKDAPIVFITANTKDFCDSKNMDMLHPELCVEAKNHGLDVHHFDGLDKFFKEWSSEALAIDFIKIKQSIPEKLVKTALLPYAKKKMYRDDNKSDNINITGMSFRIGAITGENRTLEISLSGYLTNTTEACTYLNFSAEAILRDDGNNKKIIISDFSTEKLVR